MGLVTDLARELSRSHPERAASVLDRNPSNDATRFVAALPPSIAAVLVARMAPLGGATVLDSLPAARRGDVLTELGVDVGARLLRRLDEEKRGAILSQVPPTLARTLETLLRFPEDTAGALMDPAVLALPEDCSVRDALARIREASGSAQYNLYVVDREQSLVGVLNLRELLRAKPRNRLADVMVRNPVRLAATTDIATVVGHPAWKEMRALPVVDSAGCYLGALRYGVVRQVEEQLLGQGTSDEPTTAEALGDLFAVGASGLLDAVTDSASGRKGTGR